MSLVGQFHQKKESGYCCNCLILENDNSRQNMGKALHKIQKKTRKIIRKKTAVC